MNLVLNNITHHNCSVELREKVSFTDRQRQFCLREMHKKDEIDEAAVLNTCNRTEFYISAKDSFNVRQLLAELIGQVRPDAVDTWNKFSTQSTGMDVVRHLFEVAAGLDSQMIGENQIFSQVKAAYTESIDCKMSRFLFHRLFHTAFRAGKAVRTQTNINCGAVSIALAAVEFTRKKIDLPTSSAIVIGAGENAELVAKYLLKAGLPCLIIANRNIQKAKALASRIKSCQVISLADITNRLQQVDLIIATTAAAEPVLTYQEVADNLAQREKKLLLIDIAVPRDIDPAVSRFEPVTLINIDDLNAQINHNKKKRSSEIPKAQKIIEDFADSFSRWYDSLNLIPAIAKLNKKGTELARSEARRYAKDFGKDNKEKLELFAESLIKKVLNGPISFLKKGAEDEHLNAEQLQVVDMINKMFLSEDKAS
ncbi:MAG: glutamyl-tRNA reductase [Planctomycetota bacterium]|jgi:glutamyl-tRNA reductase